MRVQIRNEKVGGDLPVPGVGASLSLSGGSGRCRCCCRHVVTVAC